MVVREVTAQVKSLSRERRADYWFGFVYAPEAVHVHTLGVPVLLAELAPESVRTVVGNTSFNSHLLPGAMSCHCCRNSYCDSLRFQVGII